MGIKPEIYFNFEPSSNKVPCGGFGVYGGGIIGKDFYSSDILQSTHFIAFIDEKDVHVQGTTVWSDKVKLVTTISNLSVEAMYEYLIANPQADPDTPRSMAEIYSSMAKPYNSKDMLNFYTISGIGAKCIGGIKDNEENQADGHLAFAKYLDSFVSDTETEIANSISTSAYIGEKIAGIERIKLYPYNMPSKEEIVNNLDDINNGLYFYLDGALVIAVDPQGVD